VAKRLFALTVGDELAGSLVVVDDSYAIALEGVEHRLV
jgi:hypothetical protein